jgi:hypothetical protein
MQFQDVQLNDSKESFLSTFSVFSSSQNDLVPTVFVVHKFHQSALVCALAHLEPSEFVQSLAL